MAMHDHDQDQRGFRVRRTWHLTLAELHLLEVMAAPVAMHLHLLAMAVHLLTTQETETRGRVWEVGEATLE